MLYIFGFFVTFVIGGLTGVMLAIVPFDWQAHNTYFVVAHFHYVTGGVVAFPLFAALYYWLPLLTGRTAVYRLSIPAFWLIFVGFNLTFFMMHLVGLLGMPRRVSTLPGNRELDLAEFPVFGGRVHHDDWLCAGSDRPHCAAPLRTPGAARSLEGRDARMGHADPARHPMRLPRSPISTRRADRIAVRELAPSLARGEGYLGFTRNGWQETLGVQMTSGAPEQLIVLPRPTYLPLITALSTAAAVLAMLFKFYWLALVMALVTAGLFVLWGQNAGHARDYGPLPVGRGLSLPPHTEAAGAPPWWAMIFALAADAALLTSLVFGVLYLWISAPNWPPAVQPETNFPLALASVAALVIAAVGGRGSLTLPRRPSRRRAGLDWTRRHRAVRRDSRTCRSDRKCHSASARARARRDDCRASRLRRTACRDRSAFPSQQSYATCRRLRVAEAPHRSPPDPNLD